jgi:hypothetical protein
MASLTRSAATDTQGPWGLCRPGNVGLCVHQEKMQDHLWANFLIVWLRYHKRIKINGGGKSGVALASSCLFVELRGFLDMSEICILTAVQRCVICLKQRSLPLFTAVTGVHLSQLKIGQSAGAKQTVFWAGNELVTRYT